MDPQRKLTKSDQALRKIEKLLRNRQQLQAIVKASPLAIISMDAEGKITSWNPAAEKTFGWKAEEVIGQFNPTVPTKGIAEFMSILNRTLAGEVLTDVELERQKNDKTIINVSLSTAPLCEANQTYGALLIQEDITESKQGKDLALALNSINLTINSTLDFDRIMQSVVVEASKALDVSMAAIDLKEKNYWAPKYLYGFPQSLLKARFSDNDAPFMALAAEYKQPVVIFDTSTDRRIKKELREQFNIGSLVAVPLTIKNEVVGVLSFFGNTPAKFSDIQIDFINKVSASVSLAIANAKLYQAQRNIADTLQEALLTVPKHIDCVRFSHLYHSATGTARVGGDFYDLFEFDHRVSMIIGDVSGKGIEAAALTSLVRNTIKAYAYEQHNPSLAMTMTNDIIQKFASISTFVTVFFGYLDVKNKELTYCNAGHPQTIIKKSNSTSLLKANSPAIGAFKNQTYTEDKIKLDKHDILIMYTDGIIEAKRGKELYGEERLLQIVEKLDGNAKTIPQHIFNDVMEFCNGKLSDDVVLLTIELK